MYDPSCMQPGERAVVLKKDIAEISRTLFIKRPCKESVLFCITTKPLVTVWGVGFHNQRRYGLKVAQLLEASEITGIHWLMLGVPYQWRVEGDTGRTPDRSELIRKCDIMMPWFVGGVIMKRLIPKYQKLVEERYSVGKKESGKITLR